MATEPHLVKVAKGREVPKDPDSAESLSTLPQTEGAQPPSLVAVSAQTRPRVSRKILSIVVVTSIVLVSMGLYWALYLRPWSMHEIESHVIDDPTAATPGFSHSLAGKTVTVEGKVTGLESRETNRGELMRVCLDNSNISLVYWDSEPYDLGDHARQAVSFEWAYLNDERHVISPQLDFPWMTLLWIGPVVNSISVVMGSVLYPEEVSDHQIRINVFDQYPLVSTSGANCTLSKGESSFVMDYLEVLDTSTYGRQVGLLPNLSAPAADTGDLSYSDADHDGNLSAGDWFDLSGIERPNDSAGLRTYMLRVCSSSVHQSENRSEVAVCYFVVGHDGLLGMASETPYIRLSVSNQTAGTVKATLVKVSAPLDWSNVTIMLSKDFDYIRWHPDAEDLTGKFQADLGVQQIGSFSVSCIVGDETGNGLMDVGDWISLTSQSQDTHGTNSTLTLIWEPVGTQMCASSFRL